MILKYQRNNGGMAYFVSVGIFHVCSLAFFTGSTLFTREMYISNIIQLCRLILLATSNMADLEFKKKGGDPFKKKYLLIKDFFQQI